METTFINVTITVSAATPTDAYNRLCDLLGVHADVEFTTDSYMYNANGGIRGGDTTDLWPTDDDTSTPS